MLFSSLKLPANTRTPKQPQKLYSENISKVTLTLISSSFSQKIYTYNIFKELSISLTVRFPNPDLPYNIQSLLMSVSPAVWFAQRRILEFFKGVRTCDARKAREFIFLGLL